MPHVIAVLPGDGIGPEVITAAVEVMEWCGKRHGLNSLGREDVARQIDAAVERSLRQGHRTVDLAPDGDQGIGTRAMAEKVLDALA